MEEIQQSPTSSASVNAGPLVTKKLFSQLTGLTEETIRGMIDRGHLPTVKVGKHRMVNVALITKEALEAEFER
ncbi:MAG: helix-turn-helix domain-containing protein [Thalassolituus sp.]|jgi:excisionase family DNA binding protein